jgi:hypothetical protein
MTYTWGRLQAPTWARTLTENSKSYSVENPKASLRQTQPLESKGERSETGHLRPVNQFLPKLWLLLNQI